MKKLLSLFFALSLALPLCAVVRVNLSGYTRLNDFVIKYPYGSVVLVNGKKRTISRLQIFPKAGAAVDQDGDEYQIKTIDFKNPDNGRIEIKCIHGTQFYNGALLLLFQEKALYCVNSVAFQDYLPGVLGAEAGERFHLEALKAMSVAMRTFYMKKHGENRRDLYDVDSADGTDMVYRGTGFITQKMREACDATEGELLRDKNGKLILPLYHSASGGFILKNEALSSLMEQPLENPLVTLDELDGKLLSAIAPRFEFTEKIDMKTVAALFGCGADEIILQSAVRYFKGTPCVDYLGVTTSRGRTLWLKGYIFVSRCQRAGFYGVRSIQFSITREDNFFVFKGRGFGHLCGMSQWSAENLAGQGWDYRAILKKYYPDAAASR